MEVTMTSLAVSRTSPPTMISSRMPQTLWKLKTISNSQTLPKYWSRFSTNRWISSRCSNSLSLTSMHTAKYRPWYRLQTILKLWNQAHGGGTSMKSVCLESRPTIIRWISDCRRTFQFQSQFMNHFDRRVRPRRFCSRMNRISIAACVPLAWIDIKFK